MLPILHSQQSVLFTKDVVNININDIVVFHHDDEDYIKRIIGTPGNIYIEDDIGQKNYYIPTIPHVSPSKYYQIKTIPQNMFFVEGDNVGESTDSRAFGLVKKSDIFGKMYNN